MTFDRVGPKVLMTAVNYRFRAISNDEAERRAVADSFARSVMWSFKVEASDATSVLVDATEFILSDQQGITRTLRQLKAKLEPRFLETGYCYRIDLPLGD